MVGSPHLKDGVQVQCEGEGGPVAVNLAAAIGLPLETLALVLWAQQGSGSEWDLDPIHPVGLPLKALALVLQAQ